MPTNQRAHLLVAWARRAWDHLVQHGRALARHIAGWTTHAWTAHREHARTDPRYEDDLRSACTVLAILTQVPAWLHQLIERVLLATTGQNRRYPTCGFDPDTFGGPPSW